MALSSFCQQMNKYNLIQHLTQCPIQLDLHPLSTAYCLVLALQNSNVKQ